MVSSGVWSLAKLMAGWVLAFALAAVTIVHHEEVRAALGLKDFGVNASDDPDAQTAAETAEREPEAEPRREWSRAGPRGSQQRPLFNRSVLITRGRDGHFHADAAINGRTLPVLVDTGATAVVLTYEDAVAAGISVHPGDFRYVSNTANGQARFARVRLDDVRIGDVAVRNVEAAVSQPGRLSTTLLGMSFLGQLRMEMKGGTLVLEQ
jgi:aspartyl protease family protein